MTEYIQSWQITLLLIFATMRFYFAMKDIEKNWRAFSAFLIWIFFVGVVWFQIERNLSI